MSGSILEKQWRTLHKAPVDNVLETIAELNFDGPRPVHIGTDAQKRGRNTDFVTAVVVLNPGKGGCVFYCKTKLDHVHSLQHKLFTETLLSLEIATPLCEYIDAEQIQVHVDANVNLRWDSAKYHQQLAGMVAGHGFKAILKPDAWCASHVADHAANCKNDSSKPKRQRKAKRARHG